MDASLVRRIDPSISKFGVQTALGALGMPGFTAYYGLMKIGEPKSGETVVVAAASGPVGSMVGQIAKLKGCRVIGVAGGLKKCQFVKQQLGFDECIDHHSATFSQQLKEACPRGIDVYFENVGGAVFDAVLPLLNNFARVPVCGLVAHYNATALPAGPNKIPLLMTAILTKRMRFEGFIISDESCRSSYSDFARDVTAWMSEGKVKHLEDITDGLENAPKALIALLKGANFGKSLIRVSPDPPKL